MGKHALGSSLCKQCGHDMVAERVRKRTDGTTYLSSYCAPCTRRSTERYRQADPAAKLWSSAKSRAAQVAIRFDLSKDDIVIPKRCPVLGIPLYFSERRTDSTPSIDRIVPHRGYTRGNIVVISWRANRLKNDATLDELYSLADFYRSLDPRLDQAQALDC